MTKISVVTICYNAVATLEQTMLSVLNQTYSNIEYIIIDGGSTDGTVDIIKKYADKLTYWISEPDKGIYDAMNKGIEKCTGEWINFMNAGDTFYEDCTINSFYNYIKNNFKADIVYGDVNIIYDWGEKIYKPMPLNSIKNNMIFCHQSCFVKSKLMKQNRFTLSYKIAGDYNFFYQQYMNNKNFFYIPLCIANFDGTNGISSKNILKSKREYAKINGNVKKIKWGINYLFFYILVTVKSVIKMFLPSNFVLYIKKNIYS